MVCFTTLPQEVIERIIFHTDNPIYSALFSSPYCWKTLTTCSIKKRQAIKDMVKSSLFKQLHWLYSMELESPQVLYSVIIPESTVEQFIRLMHIIPMKKELTDTYFQMFISTSNNTTVDKIDVFLNSGRIPQVIGNIQPLRHFPDILVRLANVMEPENIFSGDGISTAVECDCVQFLILAEKSVAVRKMVSRRDVRLAARFDCLKTLQWLHESCNCRVSNFLSCMFEDDVYDAALRGTANGAQPSSVTQWLREIPIAHCVDGDTQG